jgi:hypothetical protein
MATPQQEEHWIKIVLCGIVTLFIIAGAIGLHYAPDNDQASQANTKPNASTPPSKPLRNSDIVSSQSSDSIERDNSISVYSGNCTYYKKTWANADSNSIHYEPLSTGSAKVVINRHAKKLYFYYNGKLVFHYFGFLSDLDSVNGGEGFTFDSDADAHRYIAEHTFLLNTERMFSDLGYQYAITNYKEN